MMVSRAAFAVAVCAVMWPCAAQIVEPDDAHAQEANPKRDSRTFIFDDGFASTPGLSWRFSRPVPTVDFGGLPVAPDQPRPTEPSTLAGAPDVLEVRSTSGAIQIVASGLDHDGVTPLLVTYEFQGRYVDVFTVAGDALLEAEAAGIGRNRTVLGVGGDIMQGAYPGKRYAPAAGAVCHGLIALLCEVSSIWGDKWVVDATGIVVSQDQGLTWSLLFTGGWVQPSKNRAREWSMQNWWPMIDGPDPLEAWFAGTDYRGNPGASGGQALIFRATRPGVGQPWAIQPGTVAYEQAGNLGEHFHTAAVLPFGDDGIRTIVSIGDGQANNRIVSLTRDDKDYLSPEGWTVDERYHGSEGTPGTQGNQFVGCAPFAGGALVGGDMHYEQIMRLTFDPLLPHPTTSWVYGLGSATQGNDCNMFLVKSPTPNMPGSPYIATFQIGGRDYEGARFSRRELYSPDGERWTQAINPETTGFVTAAIHGGHIYFERRVDSPMGLYRSPLPRCLTRRPLLVGPGGLQRQVSQPVLVPKSGGVVTPLIRSPEGLWLDGGEPIDQPPTLSGPVYRVQTSKDAASKIVGTIRPTGNSLNFGNILGTDAVSARYWIRNLSTGKTCGPLMVLRTSTNSTQRLDDLRINVTDRWLPQTSLYLVPVSESERLELWIMAGQDSDDEDFYLALDSVVEGYGALGYPLAPDTSIPPNGTMNPDELSAVSGFECGPAWTATLAGEVPQDGFDATISHITRWPLAALWADEDDYIQLVADTQRRRLLIEIYSGGVLAGSIESTEIYWLRGSSVLVSLADDGSGVVATCSVGGLPIREATPSPGSQTASMAGAPTEFRFGDASGLSGDGLTIRQTPMLWWGGQVHPDAALSAAERGAMLLSLSFLDLPLGRPGCSGDLDGDGEVALPDYLAFLNYFAAGDPRADLDRSTGDGVLDALDFVAFSRLHAAGCP
jgi:hypothetical protein